MTPAALRGGHQLGLRARLLAALVAVLLVLAGCSSTGDGGNDDGDAGTGTIVGSLKSGSVKPEFAKWVNKAGHLCAQISPPLIAAQIQQESGWDSKARSGAGAQGIAQWMPGSWKSWKTDANGNGTASPWEPADAIVAQGKYMCSLAHLAVVALKANKVAGVLIQLALAGYNAGWGSVEAVGGVPGLAETQRYVTVIPKIAISTYGGHWSRPATTPPPGAEGAAGKVLGVMQAQLGTPYVWGGGTLTGPGPGVCSGVQPNACHMKGFDCSGYSRYGIYVGTGGGLIVPRTASQQQDYLAKYNIAYHGKASLKPGDVLFEGNPASHVALYYGHGQTIEEPHPGSKARVTKLWFTPSTVARVPYEKFATKVER